MIGMSNQTLLLLLLGLFLRVLVRLMGVALFSSGATMEDLSDLVRGL